MTPKAYDGPTIAQAGDRLDEIRQRWPSPDEWTWNLWVPLDVPDLSPHWTSQYLAIGSDYICVSSNEIRAKVSAAPEDVAWLVGEVERLRELLRKARRLAEMVDGPDGVVDWWAEELDAAEIRRLCAEIVARTEETP